MKQHAIGIIDSGVGGLSVFQELIQMLPHESFTYLADSKNCPYGTKTPEEIYQLAKRLVAHMAQDKIKLLVIACNTMTVHGLERLRIDFPTLPIVGIVPVVKTAAEKSKTGRIGILSTIATDESLYQKHLIEEFASDCFVVSRGTDTLVPLVERGELDGEKVRKILREELAPFIDAKIDALALGCSHFPFLKKPMQSIVGDNVLLLDSSGAIARQTVRILQRNSMQTLNQMPHYLFKTTGDASLFQTVASKLLSQQDQVFRNVQQIRLI